mgnify:CR=1 FL=1|jgi:hypothetical protein
MYVNKLFVASKQLFLVVWQIQGYVISLTTRLYKKIVEFTKASAEIIQTIIHLRFLLHINGKFRRFLLVHFQKQYIKDQLLIRQGNCQQCGFCCNMLFTCPMLGQQGGCAGYGLWRPKSCKVFPIDQSDIDEVFLCGGKCGYYFEKD